MKRLLLSVFSAILFLSVSAQTRNKLFSKVETKTLKSEILKADRDYNIFFPKSYDVDTDKKYPILYLLHGMSGTNVSWFENERAKDVADLLMASGEACEMIIVSPNAGGDIYKGDWNGYFNMPGWSYESFFFEEFLPHIESTYRVIGDKQHRAIAGLSMGGGGSTNYAQRYSDMFCAVYAMSALMSIPDTGNESSQSRETTNKMTLLTRSVIQNSCIKYIENASEEKIQQLRKIAWFVDCGDDDFLLDRNIEFVQAMRKAGISLEFRVRDGDHNSEYWHTSLYTCLPFVTRNFGK